MDVLRQLQENKQCFDCHEKGTTYTLMAPWGVFICSTCAGLHRDFSHKAKGIAMSNYTDVEIAFLRENGNKAQQVKLMPNWKAKRDPEPQKSELTAFKEFLRQKYVLKKFAEADQDSDSSDSEDERKKRKAKKQAKKDRKMKQEVVAEAEDSPPDEAPTKQELQSAKGSRKLGAPPGSSKLQSFTPVTQPETKPVGSLLEFGATTFGQPEAPATSNNDDWAGGWGDFEEPAQNQAQQQAQPVIQQQIQPAAQQNNKDHQIASLLDSMAGLNFNNQPQPSQFPPQGQNQFQNPQMGQMTNPLGGQMAGAPMAQANYGGFQQQFQMPQQNQIPQGAAMQQNQQQQAMLMMQMQQMQVQMASMQSNPAMQSSGNAQFLQQQKQQQMMQQMQQVAQQQQKLQQEKIEAFNKQKEKEASVAAQVELQQQPDAIRDIFESFKNRPLPNQQTGSQQMTNATFNPFEAPATGNQQANIATFNPFDAPVQSTPVQQPAAAAFNPFDTQGAAPQQPAQDFNPFG